MGIVALIRGKMQNEKRPKWFHAGPVHAAAQSAIGNWQSAIGNPLLYIPRRFSYSLAASAKPRARHDLCH
jgi:hypothetical protein